ncbi:MAG: DUF975 family protein [Clostridia bacterium]|nr:DUF975 family protein [Clostridia bacterium]
MYGSMFYKHEARGRLRGCYSVAVICAILFMIPQYLMSRIMTMIDITLPGSMLIRESAALLVQLLVVNIFEIGFIRFLLRLRPGDGNSIRSYDYNLILSGYTENFAVSLRATLMASLKLFLLFLLALTPTAALVIYIALRVPVDTLARIATDMSELAMSYSPQAVTELSQLINSTFPHLSLFTGLYIIATIGAISPFIYKTYEYKMIPFILAEKTDIAYSSVKNRTHDLMEGFRMKFFLIQLSFIGYMFILATILTLTGSILIYSAGTVLLLPYQYMTYLEFYRQRTEVIEHNIEVYGNRE